MPWDIGGYARYEFSQSGQFFLRIVKSRHQQGDDFEPDPHFMNAADSVQNGLEAATKFSILAVVETL